MPGHTRRLSTTIKISVEPPVYIYDTPGIMVPFLGRGTKGKEAALKLALTGGIKESLFEGDTVAEYLLWRLRMRAAMRDEGYTEGAQRDSSFCPAKHSRPVCTPADDLLASLALPPSTPLDSPTLFLEALALRLSAVQKGGVLDTDFAGRWLIHAFREGKLGRWTLDAMGRGGEAVDVEKESGQASETTSAAAATSYLSRTSEIEEDVQDTTATRKATIDSAVDSTVAQYLATQASPNAEDMSGHQAKKQLKAEQARVRDVKRKSHAVTAVKRPGPGPGISSARRRKYRRGS